MSHKTDFARIVRSAESQGWRVRRTQGNHWQLYSPNEHTIVIAASTPSDHRGWGNFLSEMRKGGFMEAPNLGHSPEYRTNGEAKPGSGTISDALRALLKKAPGSVDITELEEKVKARGYKPAGGTLATILRQMAARGEIVRKGRGLYCWHPAANEPQATEVPETPKALPPAPAAPAEPTPASAAPSALAAADFTASGVFTGDSDVDADLKAIDDALSALSKLDEVIRRNRAVRAQVVVLKKLLGAI